MRQAASKTLVPTFTGSIEATKMLHLMILMSGMQGVKVGDVIHAEGDGLPER